MKKCGVKWLMITSVTVGFAAAAQAEDFDIGKSEFQSSCASCHGTDAKGKGPVSDQLKIPPPDLTMLAKNNNGVFPTNAVYETIYGLKTITLTALVKCQFGGNDSTPLSTCLTMLIRLIGRWPGRSKARKSSCEHASSLLSII
jgi:hypothetical protein